MRKYELKRRDKATRYTERCLKKISETSKGRVPFSKGLTKYDHPAIMKISESVSGEKAGRWKGGYGVNSTGYRYVRDINHPNRDKDNYVLEHRLVMEKDLNRYLTSEEVVHHRDRNRLNNCLENLYLFPNNRSHTCFHNHQKYYDPMITEEKFMEEIFYGKYGY
ncbi:hypothetical protein GJU41_11925 [Bacillus idriensis]|uniref:Uncharacterized protein n=2 Tax=Metabacillus idriensis TaxID=324768 RepID=A0A6I2ME40_9BACI|nr:hypothetical protein [Metabacillus idriensis]